mgnify:CR=1 FL=1
MSRPAPFGLRHGSGQSRQPRIRLAPSHFRQQYRSTGWGIDKRPRTPLKAGNPCDMNAAGVRLLRQVRYSCWQVCPVPGQERTVTMRKVITILMLAVLTALWVDTVYAGEKEPLPRPAGEVTSVPSGEGWVDLFDGNNARLWKVDAENLFEFQDGQMHIFGHKPTHYIQYTGDTYGDFQVHLEFKLTVKANSGLMFRAAPEDPVFKGMEIQIIDSYGEDPNYSSCGALYDVAAPMFNMVNKTGEWNSLDLTVQGKHIVAVVNNWKVLDLDVSKMTMPIGKFPTPLNELPVTGSLFLQDHGNEVWFRNMRVKKL